MKDYIELLDGLDINLEGKKLVIGNIDYTPRSFSKCFFEIVEMKGDALELLVMKQKDNAQYNKIMKRMYDMVVNSLKPKMDIDSKLQSSVLNNLTPVSSLEDDNVFLINTDTQVVMEVNYKSFLRGLDIAERKLVQNSAMPLANFYFDPYNPETKVEKRTMEDGEDAIFINTYRAPTWLKGSDSCETMPKILEEFINHLLPSKKQRTYCLQWMAEAMFGKNETYLVLNGDKGVGKNTIYEILKAVIAPRYSVTAPASLTTSHFNSVLLDKRLILLDEYKITRANHLFLKKIINKNQTIEKKGVDADKEVETYNSFMVFHNSVSDMYVEKDDRRFSVLDLTHKNLTDIWTPDYIHELMIDLNDPNSEFTKEVGQYLLHVHETQEFNNVTPYKGNKFHEIVEYHMPTWLQIVVAMVENGEVKNGAISFKKEIEKRLANEMMGKKKIQWRKSTLQKTLKEYRYKDQWVLGEITSKGTGGSLQLEINKELLEEFNYEEEVDDFGLEEDLL